MMLNIKVKFFGLRDLSRLIGNEEIEVQLDGETFGDALKYLENTYGEPFRQTILNDKGEVNTTIQVMKNESEFLLRDQLAYRLEEGDELLFYFMIAGG